MKRLIRDEVVDRSSAMYTYLVKHNLFDIDDVKYD